MCFRSSGSSESRAPKWEYQGPSLSGGHVRYSQQVTYLPPGVSREDFMRQRRALGQVRMRGRNLAGAMQGNGVSHLPRGMMVVGRGRSQNRVSSGGLHNNSQHGIPAGPVHGNSHGRGRQQGQRRASRHGQEHGPSEGQPNPKGYQPNHPMMQPGGIGRAVAANQRGGTPRHRGGRSSSRRAGSHGDRGRERSSSRRARGREGHRGGQGAGPDMLGGI